MTIWDLLPYAAGSIAILAIAATVGSWRKSSRSATIRRLIWRFAAIFCATTATISTLLVVATFWYTHRSQPEPASTRLFQGVNYLREIRSDPRPLVIHVIKVDLQAEGVRFLVTPDDPSCGRMLRARKTTEFLDEFGVQVAINANYFFPFFDNGPWQFYPRPGDPVDVCGAAASNGKVYSTNRWTEGTLYLSVKNQASFDEPIGPVDNAITGNGFLLRGGRDLAPPADTDLYPRSAIGLDREARTLILLVVDGKQPHYSEGCTLAELASILADHGAYDAIRLDEGGSATLATQTPDGRALLLNCPINSRIPGLERPVANHLGVFARP